MDEDIVLGLFALAVCLCSALLVMFFRRARISSKLRGVPGLLLGNVLVFLWLSSALLLAGEIYFRFIYDSTDSLAYTRVNILWGKRHWRVNNFQMRDNVNYQPEIQNGKRRVTFVGDSFTAGHGIKNVEDRLVNRIRKAHPEWEIHMLARIGADTGEELNFVQIGVSHGYQLDQVVLVYCLNDISDLMPERTEAMERLRKELAQAGWFRSNSYLVDVLYHRFQARRDPFMRDYFAGVLDAYRGPLWEQQKERLKTLLDYVSANGGRLSVVTFPFVHALGPDYKYRFVHEQLAQFWKELGVQELDLMPVLEKYPAKKLVVNQLDVHPNEFANSLAAIPVGNFLTEQMGRGTNEIKKQTP